MGDAYSQFMESHGDDVLASWQRSAGDYDSAPVEEFIAFAREDNDRLFAPVGKVGYALLLAAADGVVVDVRGKALRVFLRA